MPSYNLHSIQNRTNAVYAMRHLRNHMSVFADKSASNGTSNLLVLCFNS